MNKAVYRSISILLSIVLVLGSYFSAGALSAVGAPALATPKTYYVSPTGNDTNTGTASAPFKTFTKAVSVLAAGDVLLIYGGTYAQQLKVSKSGTAVSPITIQPVLNQKVIIDGEMIRDRAVIVTGSYVAMNGLETQRALQFCVDITGSNITVKNFNVHDCQKFGARIKGKNVILEGSTLHDNVLSNMGGTNTASGWQGSLRVGLGSENVTLRNNTIYNNWGEGIGVGQGRFVNVYNNIVHDNFSQNIYINNSTDVNVENNFTYSIDSKYFRSGMPANCIGMADEYYSGWGAQLARVRVINNIAAFCKRGIGYTYSENAGGGMDAVTIAYNTIWGSTEAGIVVINQPVKTRNSVIANNIVQQANGRLVDIQVTTGITYSNNFWVSPAQAFKSGPGDRTGDIKFAAAPGLTPELYRLSGASSAIAGATSLGVTKDFAGNSRGPSYDMGAMQYMGVISTTPTSPVIFTPTNTPTLLPSSTPVSATTTQTPIPSTATATMPILPTVTNTPQAATGTATASPTATIANTPSSGRPGYLEPYIDPVHGAKIIRVADDSWGSVCRHHYSKDEAWNADQSVIWLNKGCDKFVDGNTYAPLPNLKSPPDSGGESRWHPVDPNIMIYTSGETLGKWNPFTGQGEVVATFPGYANLMIGLSEGNLSADGKMIALYSTGVKKAFAYDLVNKIKYPDIDLSGEIDVNSVTMSYTGKYVQTNIDLGGSSDSGKVFDLDGNLVSVWPEYGCPSHYDFTVDQNGEDIAVGVCKSGYSGIVKRRLSDGQITVIFPMGASHTSARNINRPGWVYISQPYYAPYLNEVIAIKLDGTTFERIAYIPNNKADYESEMHASPSLDGKKIIVASNWNIGSRPVQSYVIEITGATITPGNTPTLLPSSTPVSATATQTPIPMTATQTQIAPSSTPTAVLPTATLTATSQPGTETVYDDLNSAFVFSSGWQDLAALQAYDGSYKTTAVYGASVKLDFTGQSFSILYTDGPKYRRMAVYVDGVFVKTIYRKTSVTTYQQRWDYPGQLAPGVHTIELVFINGNGALDAVIVR